MTTITKPHPVAVDLEEHRNSPTPWLVVVGALSVLMLVYLMSYWGASSATPTHTGADPVPTITKVWAILWQVGGVAVLIGAVIFFWRQTRRLGRLSIEAMVFIAWTINVWQDPLSNNFIRPQLLYNSYLINFGSWAPHIPGWLSPNAHYLPEPIVAYTGIYGAQVALSLIGVVAMRRAKARWPQMSKLGLLGCCLLTLMVVDLVLEMVLIRAGLYAYAGGIRNLSLFSGKTYQFPVYETVVYGSILTAVSGLMFFRDDRGLTFAERRIDESRHSRQKVTTLRILSVTGFVTLVYLAYAVVWCGASIYGGPYPSGYKSYMINGVCGPGTAYECPSPKVPIPLPNSGPQT